MNNFLFFIVTCLISLQFNSQFDKLGNNDFLTVVDTSNHYIPFIILAGQSNAGGRVSSSWPLSYQVTYPGVYENFNGTGWGIMDGTSVLNGSEIQFGKVLKPSFTQDLYIIKRVRGGTALCNQEPGDPESFLPQIGSQYILTIADINAAKAYASSINKTPYFVGFFWMQGECDSSGFGTCVADYQSNLENLIADVRSNTRADLPVVLGDLAQSILTPFASDIRQSLQNVATQPNTSFCSSVGYPTEDPTHYNYQGLISLGNCFSSELKILLNSCN